MPGWSSASVVDSGADCASVYVVCGRLGYVELQFREFVSLTRPFQMESQTKILCTDTVISPAWKPLLHCVRSLCPVRPTTHTIFRSHLANLKQTKQQQWVSPSRSSFRSTTRVLPILSPSSETRSQHVKALQQPVW